MAKNFKIADIDRNARYTVATIDNWDGHAERREMTGAELIDFTNAAAHLYDIHAELIPAAARSSPPAIPLIIKPSPSPLAVQ